MAEMMRAVRKVRPGPGFELVEVEIPRIKDKEVLVKVEATAICGSDMHFYRWDAFAQKKMTPPLTIGHEFAGEIVEVGSQVLKFKVGDYITADSHIVCGECDICRMGLQHICQNMKIFGNEVDGSYAEYIAVPVTSLWKLDRSIPPEQGAILEPLGGAAHAVLIEPVTSKSVVIFGDGPIGLFGVGVARAAGASQVLLVGISPQKLEIGKRMGATATFDALNEPDLVARILALTGGIGADVVVELSGARQAFEQSFASVRKGGRVTLFGIPSSPLEFDFAFNVILREITVKGVAGRHMWDTWNQVSGLLQSGRLDPSPVITHQFPLEEFEKGFELMTALKCGKVILIP